MINQWILLPYGFRWSQENNGVGQMDIIEGARNIAHENTLEIDRLERCCWLQLMLRRYLLLRSLFTSISDRSSSTFSWLQWFQYLPQPISKKVVIRAHWPMHPVFGQTTPCIWHHQSINYRDIVTSFSGNSIHLVDSDPNDSQLQGLKLLKFHPETRYIYPCLAP